ncbi:hypothetical protein C8F04DRAFT_659795 [Mycena alexandri]|uniref:RING-type domain-containing protein n=1 Tax=Mycena alexandri TaxID=1745969 RepID=A0AAD6SSR8_9AGAR|nr:hypothetical protein C8F04DRAFT_659795 [Mycena alexandri]
MTEQEQSLLIVVDATGSMEAYLDALRESIPEILALAKLSGAFSRLGVLAYKDYSEPTDQIAAWSGWNAPDLQHFVGNLQASGGGDFPEAAKTALIRALQAADKDAQTLCLWYSDAPPHHMSIQSYQNDVDEVKAFPPGAVDWVKLCHTARRRRCTMFCFTPRSMERQFSAFYVLLSELTGGICIGSKATSTDLSRLTLGVILQWMGRAQTSGMTETLRHSSAVFLRYERSPLTVNPKLADEGLGSRGYLPPSRHSSIKNAEPLLRILSTPLEVSNIPVRVSSTLSFDLGKRFADPAEVTYRSLVFDSLTAIIRTNVASLTYNPIFGQLWRAVCKGTDERKTALANLFSHFVGKEADPEKKADLRQWLEDSFDQTEEIEGIIKRHCANGPTPMVYLDFDADVHLTRTELLEVSRSCYPPVLKKIARVFTHLKLVEPGITLGPLQRSIPLTLPPRDFYRLMPHLIVPGTLYPPRAATLTAVVSLITAVPFLKESATALLATTKGTWLNLDVPENISFDCARFLLSGPMDLMLTSREKRVYEAMRRYKLIELNLDAPVEVHVPWTPQKTRGPGDVKIQCKRCFIHRSVTIMSHEHQDLCGICASLQLPPVIVLQNFPGVAEQDSCWVECSTQDCRAQYVVENVAGLQIRPRCHYCRKKVPCPWIECSICTNRVIVPSAYRLVSEKYTCPACNNHAWASKCIATVETTVRILNKENGLAWLGFSDNATAIFDGKSAFKLMQASGMTIFGHRPLNLSPNLSLGQKALRYTEQILGQVESRVGNGEVVLGSCSLCFEEKVSTKLGNACGRTGCAQLCDDECLREWYGQNRPGKLLNMMQFTCPFCRRKPTIKTLARYNRPAAVLGGVQEAMGDRRFLYAWCMGCGSAKQAYERTACTEEAVPPISNFRCQDCRLPRRIPGRVVICPSSDCGYVIKKTDGCNHMICVCGTHFCYTCGEEFGGSEIYSHMMSVHGSWYDLEDL